MCAIRTKLAEVYCDLGEYRNALAQLEIADLGTTSRALRAAGSIQLARAHNGLKDYGSAVVAAGIAVEEFAQSRPRLHVRSLMALADAKDGLGEVDAARKARAQALPLATELGIPEAEKLRRILRAEHSLAGPRGLVSCRVRRR